MFLHFLPFYFIFFHFLFLSFSFSLLCAQNLIFLGLNFVTISLDSSCVKKHFLGPSRGWVLHPFGSSFPFFPFVFSPVFCLFFLLFIFLFFLIFCSFLHFFDFLMCFIFSIFSEEKSVFFSFFLYFFQLCFIAGISVRFNFFLRSRCSMEMWCPDDIGRG